MGSFQDNDVKEIRPSKKPQSNKFIQQELSACRPLLTPGWVLLCLFGVAAVFVPIGVTCYVASHQVVEISHRYDTCITEETSNAQRSDILKQTSAANGYTCPTVTLEIPADMHGPVYVYYELDNFYQNHRRYVKSRSNAQLNGENVDVEKETDCAPQQYADGNTFLPVSPCGLIAWTYFNDTYEISSCSIGEECQPLSIATEGIAWESDVKGKFGSQLANNFNMANSTRGGQTITGPLNEDERFIVWMRTAALPHFRKLWGSIKPPATGPTLRAGDSITINIQNRYNTYDFDGKKTIVLSTANWLGGANDFLGIAYITVGAISFGFGMLFFAFRLRNPRQMGNMAYLSWNKGATSLAKPLSDG